MSHLQQTETDDRRVWRLDRPERGNGLGTSLAKELADAMDALRIALAAGDAAGAALKPLVLTASPLEKDGRATWIAGGDLKELQALASAAEAEAYAGTLGRLCAALTALPIPVIAAIDGAAIGGGAELALWCDERLATRRSSLELRQLAVGLPCGYGTTRRLVDLVGLARAQRLVYRTERLTADAAEAAGLVDEVVEDAAALEAAVSRAVSRWRGLAPEAVTAQKAMFRLACEGHPGATREGELALFRAAWGNSHHRGFLARFGAGKTP